MLEQRRSHDVCKVCNEMPSSGAAGGGWGWICSRVLAAALAVLERCVLVAHSCISLRSTMQPYCAAVTLQAGFKRLAEAAVGLVPSMEPQQVTDLVVGFHK
jgi:hypothetical protein